MHDKPDEGPVRPQPEGEGPEAPGRRGFLKTTAVGAVGMAVVGCGDDDADMGPSMDGGADADVRRDADANDAGEADGGSDGGMADSGPESVDPPEGTPGAVGFDLSVAAGDATADSVVLWTRYSGMFELNLVVWEMDGSSYGDTVWNAPAVPADGGFVHVDVAGLQAGRRYRYVFFEVVGSDRNRSARSPLGRFRTAIADDAMDVITIGACSCTHNEREPRTLEWAAEHDELDAFLHVGDTSYNDDLHTLAEYRARWADNLSKSGYRAIRSATGAYCTWDDHEVDNDYDPETIDPSRLARARQVYFENQPVRREKADPDRIWKRMRWGRTLELFVLDCRSERRPSTKATSSAIYVSRAQMNWLKDGLLDSPAVFKVIVNSVPITDFPGGFDLAARDRWEGYPAQRQEILRHIDDNRIGGVLWVAGDFHMASMQRVSLSGPGAGQTEVLVGPGAHRGNILARTLTRPQFDFATDENNYAILRFDPLSARVRIVYRNESGNEIHTGSYDL